MKDLMLLNGKIYTMNPKQPKAEAVAVKDSKVIAVGKTSDVENLGKRNFKVINLQGKTVVPGFIDCHTHFFSFALSLNQVNLDLITSFDQIISQIKTFAKKLRPKEWLLGRGWDKNILRKRGSFTKEVLDKICPQNPVALRSKDHHLLWVNSLALKLAGINKYKEDPSGGKIDRDHISGEPTGLLKENACELVWKKIRSPSPEKSKRLLAEAMKLANSFGLTGIHNLEEQKPVFFFQQFLSAGSRGKDEELSLRVCFWISKEDLDCAISLGLRSGFGSENLRFGGVKLYSDGALGSQTALMFEPYENSRDNFGIEVTSQEELTQWVKKASQAGINVSIHSIGDKGVHQALNAIERSTQDKNLRHRIEHAQLICPQDMERFSKLGVIASVQPYHATSDQDVVEAYWGKREGFRYSYKSLLNNQTKLVFGSDAPIETMDALRIIRAAVTRKKEGERRRAWYPQECLSVPEAVFAYTQGASYASYEEKIKGSIEIGKLADMVVLSKDIFEKNPEEILDTKVESTILGGKLV